MIKIRTAHLLTSAIIVAAIATAVVRAALRSPAPQTPGDAIYAAMDAARTGDVNRYLDAFAGPLAAPVRRAAAEQSEAMFRQYLVGSRAAVKGVALSDPEWVSDSQARIRVEYVYQDRNEKQVFDLEKISGKWKITGLSNADPVRALIPYGTPVKDR